MATNPATVEIGQPRLFTMRAVSTVTAYGFLLLAPVFVSMLAVSVIPFGMLTILIPVLMLAGAAFFLPFGQGNTHVARLVRSFSPAADMDQHAYVVQLTLEPRIRSGLRAWLDDADDVGWLSFGDAALIFTGDSVKLCIPYDHIERVQPRNIGLRGGFVNGRRIAVSVPGLPEAAVLEFAERSSYLLPASRRISRELYRRLAAKVLPREEKSVA